MSDRIDLSRAAAEIQSAALRAADPAEAVRRHVRRVVDWVLVDDQQYRLPEIEHVWVVAIGKAALAMADAALDLIGNKVAAGVAITLPFHARALDAASSIEVLAGGHPVPDPSSLAAGERIAALFQHAGENDLSYA